MVGEGGLHLAVMGPKLECEKLKEAYDNMKEVAKFIMEEDNN